ALAHGELQAGAAVRVRRRIRADALGLFHRGTDLLARVGAARGHGARRAHAAGDEDLHVIRAAAQVLARATPDFLDAGVARQPPSGAVVGRETAPRDEQPRAGNHPGVDRIANVDVDEMLLAHDPHRRRAGREVSPQIARRGQRLRHRSAAELAELIALTRDDRCVRVAIDETGHHETVTEIERLGARRERATAYGSAARAASI